MTGVVPEALDRFMRELPKADPHHHHQVSTYEVEKNPNNRVVVVETMHERKALMYKLADAYVALPGGFGTWEELLEALTHQQLGRGETKNMCAVKMTFLTRNKFFAGIHGKVCGWFFVHMCGESLTARGSQWGCSM